MRKVFSLLLLTFLFIFSSSVFAHPGRTAADGCHYCRTKCDYWGVPWNERHCHGRGAVQGVQESAPVYNPPTNTPIPWPTWTPVPTYMPVPTNTSTPTLTSTPTPKPTKSVLSNFNKKVVNKVISKKKTVKKKTFWQWLLNR